MPILQPILNLAELLSQKGITEVIVSPGSRSAPLTLAVARHPRLRVRVVADERSAGFVALGIAQQTKKPVVLICTSGSAVYNLAPAVAEAYFQEVPLLLLTADRPREWVHQQDGQTMYQTGIFGQHVKRSYELPADYDHPDSRWFMERSANEAVNLTLLDPPGPVHINVPVREPFYPKPGELFQYEPVRVVDALPVQVAIPTEGWHQLMDEWEQADRRLIAIGQLPNDPILLEVLQKISDELQVPIVGEIMSNLPDNGMFITHSDTFLASSQDDFLKTLQPDLLITFGLSFLARNLKTFLRQYPARRHWHISPAVDRITDPFRSLTTLIPTSPGVFMEKLFADLDYQHFLQGDDIDDDNDYLSRWQTADRKASRLVQQSVGASKPFTDWSATQAVMEALPTDSILQLANSMPVRYANLCGLRAHQRVAVFANRGVSGIDGCLSTAVGAALTTDKIVTLFIGDVAFFYDRNGLWNSYIPKNLRIVLFNNQGGHIFRMIDGPGQQPELETYFEVDQPLNAGRTAADAHILYRTCANQLDLDNCLSTFFEPDEQASLLEIKTDKLVNKAEFSAYKAQINEIAW